MSPLDWYQQTTTEKTKRTLFNFGIAVVWIAVFILLRRHSILSTQILNPDEGELIATGQRAALSLIPYKTSTTPTFGVVWSYFLGLLSMVKVPMTIPVAHLLSALLDAITIIIATSILAKYRTKLLAVMLLTPLGLVWASGGFPRANADVNALSTLQLPTLLILIGLLIFLRDEKSKLHYFLLGFVFSLAIIAKYQFGPLALITIAALHIRRDIKSVQKIDPNLPMAIIGLTLPPIALVIASLMSGTFSYLWTEGVGWMVDYLNHRQELTGSLQTNLTTKFSGTIEFLLATPLFIYLGIYATYTGIQKFQDRKDGETWNIMTSDLMPLVVLITVLLSLMPTWPLFANYSHLTIAGSLVAIVLHVSHVPQNIEPLTKSHRRRNVAPLLIIFAVLVGYVLPDAIQSKPVDIGWSKVLTTSGGQRPRTAEDGIDYLARYCPPKSDVFVWGWSGELYSQYGWNPVSRYVVSTWLLMGTSRKASYEKTLASEIKQTQPRCVVEALAPGFFGPFGSDMSIFRTSPQIYKTLSNYKLVSGNFAGSNPVSIYVLNEKEK